MVGTVRAEAGSVFLPSCRRRCDLKPIETQEEEVQETCLRRWMVTERWYRTGSVFRFCCSLSPMALRYLQLPAACRALVRFALRTSGAPRRTVGSNQDNRLTLTGPVLSQNQNPA